MNVRQTIAQYNGRLTSADERLVKELLAHPAEISFLTAAEFARRVDVHEATVVRLAKKLGFQGYPDLRTHLQAEVLPDLQSLPADEPHEGDSSSPSERVRQRLAQVGAQSILGRLVADETAALHDIVRQIPQAQLETAAQMIYDAKRVFLFGRGHATALVELMDRRLRRSGCDTIDLRSQGRDLAERLLSLRADDLVLAFAFRSRPTELQPLLEHCTAVGGQSILISDTLGPLIRPAPHLLLAARRGTKGAYLTLTVPMIICDALTLTLSRLDGGRTFRSLERLDSLQQQMAGDEEQERG